MEKSDVYELLANLYLRLNGYFTSGFIAHAPSQNIAEVDVMAVRFPRNREPEREVATSEFFDVPRDRIDFVICEVKGGENPRFNASLCNDNALAKIFRWIGAFDDEEISRLCAAAAHDLQPASWRERVRKGMPLPEYEVCDGKGVLRFKLFAAEMNRKSNSTRPYIFGDDMLQFAWKCFRPNKPRPECATSYDFGLWASLEPLRRYFEQKHLTGPGTVKDLCDFVLTASG